MKWKCFKLSFFSKLLFKKDLCYLITGFIAFDAEFYSAEIHVFYVSKATNKVTYSHASSVVVQNMSTIVTRLIHHSGKSALSMTFCMWPLTTEDKKLENQTSTKTRHCFSLPFFKKAEQFYFVFSVKTIHDL